MKPRDILIALFVLIFMIFIAVSYKLISSYISPPIDELQIYAGIEIGTTSVRFAIVEKTKKGINVKKQGQMFPPNTGPLLDPKKAQIEPILSLVENALNQIIIPAKIPDKNIYIVLGNSYEKEEAGNLNTLKEKLESKYNKYKIDLLNEKTEGLMEMLTLVSPPDELEKLLLIGIGSKSTKVSIYTNDDSAFANQTLGLDDLVEKVRPELSNNQDFQKMTEKIRLTLKESVDNFINNNVFRGKNIVIITGGIGRDILCETQQIKNCQSITEKNYIESQSDKNINDYSPISIKSLNDFRKVLENSYKNGKGFDANYQSPYSRYSREKQLVGLEFTQVLLETLDTLNNKNKTAFFYERITWMPGYIVFQIKNAEN